MDRHLPTSGLRQWTVMVYMAGDNNLETYGIKDLDEMKAVGSSDEVAIVAQFDRMSDQVTRRYYLTARQKLDADCVAQLPEVNTGDPNALLDFIVWACQNYSAKHYALVLWNHGAGWKDDDIYKVARQHNVADKITRGQVRGIASGKASRAFFSTTLEKLVLETAETERAILFDDSSADFLDNQEMKNVLQEAVLQTGQPFDLLGFDACLMSMLEVHYQIRDICRVAVGSQEIEPGDGWPYDLVMAHLVSDPGMTPETLGRAIVENYIDFYTTNYPHLSVTQSAVNLANIETVAKAVDNLAGILVDSLEDQASLGLLFSALRSSQTFRDRDYIDLAHFCQLLAKENSNGKIRFAAQQVFMLLTGENSPIIAEQHRGSAMDNAYGLSIYLPIRTLSPLYGQLQFAQKYSWDEFLEAFINPH